MEGLAEWGVDALRCEFTWETNQKRGTLRKNLYVITLMNRFYILCFFIWWGLCLTLNSDSAINPRALLSNASFSDENERVTVCVKACICNKVSHAHKRWIRLGRSSEPCRGLSEFSFEMYIQCEGLKWFFFLLNSIFYRFCRHFVVGRKKIKRNFMGEILLHFSNSHTNHNIIYQINP